MVNLSKNFPLLLMFLRYHVYVTCCVYIHFCNCAHYLLLSSVVPTVGDSLIWALSHSPSLQCLYLTSLLYNPVVFPFLVNGWWMCSEVLFSQWQCYLARSQLEKFFLEGPFLEKQPGTRALPRCSIWFVLTEDLDIHCSCGVSPGTWRVMHQRWVTLRDL